MLSPLWQILSGNLDYWQVYLPSPQDMQAVIRWVSDNFWTLADYSENIWALADFF
jgi:hypothetical protein